MEEGEPDKRSYIGTTVIFFLGATLASILGVPCIQRLSVESQRRNLEIVSEADILAVDNCDSDTERKPFRDRLFLVDQNGAVSTYGVFNFDNVIGQPKCLGITNTGQVIMSEDAQDMLLIYDASGRLMHKRKIPVFSLDISLEGDIYCSSTSTLNQGDLLKIDSLTGGIKQRTSGPGGIDLVFMDEFDLFWVVGKEVSLYDSNLVRKFPPIQMEGIAASVDYMRSDGSAWIARQGKKGGRSKSGLVNISLEGRVLSTIPLGTAPLCVGVNQTDGEVWVADSKGLLRNDPDGKKIQRIATEDIQRVIRYNPRDNTFWAAGDNICQYDSQGNILRTIPATPGTQKFLAVRKYFPGINNEDNPPKANDDGQPKPKSKVFAPKKESKSSFLRDPNEAVFRQYALNMRR